MKLTPSLPQLSLPCFSTPKTVDDPPRERAEHRAPHSAGAGPSRPPNAARATTAAGASNAGPSRIAGVANTAGAAEVFARRARGGADAPSATTTTCSLRQALVRWKIERAARAPDGDAALKKRLTRASLDLNEARAVTSLATDLVTHHETGPCNRLATALASTEGPAFLDALKVLASSTTSPHTFLTAFDALAKQGGAGLDALAEACEAIRTHRRQLGENAEIMFSGALARLLSHSPEHAMPIAASCHDVDLSRAFDRMRPEVREAARKKLSDMAQFSERAIGILDRYEGKEPARATSAATPETLFKLSA